MQSLWRHTFKHRVAINMLICVLLFGWFGSVPRETISGFLGRKGSVYMVGAKPPYVWSRLMRFVDWLHRRERKHCLRVAQEEHSGWLAMYPERYRQKAPKHSSTHDAAGERAFARYMGEL